MRIALVEGHFVSVEGDFGFFRVVLDAADDNTVHLTDGRTVIRLIGAHGAFLPQLSGRLIREFFFGILLCVQLQRCHIADIAGELYAAHQQGRLAAACKRDRHGIPQLHERVQVRPLQIVRTVFSAIHHRKDIICEKLAGVVMVKGQFIAGIISRCVGVAGRSVSKRDPADFDRYAILGVLLAVTADVSVSRTYCFR